MVGAAHVPLVVVGAVIPLDLVGYLGQKLFFTRLQSHITLPMVLNVAERPLQVILR